MTKKLRPNGRFPGMLKSLLTVKFSVVCMALSVLSLSAGVHAQKTFADFKMSDASLADVLRSIESRSDYTCLYSDEDVAEVGNINIELTNATVRDILDRCFEGTRLEYVIVDNTVVVRRMQQPPVTERVVKGVVKDPSGAAVIGAAVVMKGSTRGAATDAAGEFSLTVPDQPNVVLVVSFLGKQTREVPVTGTGKLDIVLQDDAQNIDEVVVTGIFTREAASFTGSVVTMSKDQLLTVGNQNVFQSLKNIDPSLMIFDNMEFGSDPNRTPKMQLRGTSSFDLGGGDIDLKGTYGYDPNEPLFILDGFEATVEKIMDLDMNRVESVTILKDASAKAIYGSKAANGVVVIETKKTTEGELRVTYTGSVDITAPDLSSYNLVNAAQKLEIEKDAGLYVDDNNPVGLLRKYNRILTAVLAGVDTDWLAKPLRTGVGTKHTLSIELGNNDLRVIGDLSFNRTLGVMKGSDRTNTSGTVMVSYRHKKFNFRNILSVTSNVGNDSPYGQFSEYARMNPYWSPYDENGLLMQNIVFQYSDNPDTETDFVANPLYNASLNTLLKQEYIDVTNNTYVEWNIMQGLKATGRFGITEKRTKADEFYPANHLKFRSYNDEDFFRRGSYQKNEGRNKTMTADLNVNWTRTFGAKHVVFGNAGFTMSENSFEEDIYNAEGFPNDKMNNIIFAKQYLKDTKPTGVESTVRDLGFLAVANYSYDYRYLVDASYRASASSQFGSNNRWGQFWSVGAGWNIYNEPWMKRFDKLQLLKLRGSVGYTGAQSSEAYAAMASYLYFMEQNYDGYLGAYLKGMKNDELKWQEKLDYNVGLDLNWNNIVTMKFDYYISQTKNTLIDFTLPPSTGFSYVKENVGDVRNVGFDAYLTVTPWRRPEDRSFFTITGAISHNENKITGISNALDAYNKRQDELAGDRFENRPVQRYYEGVSMDAIWAVRSLGIDPATGNEIFLTPNGRLTNVWSAANQVICGNSLPKFQGNIGFNASWKGIGVNVTLRYQWGGQYYNQTVVDLVENADLNYNVDKRVYEGRWRNPGDVKPYKRLSYTLQHITGIQYERKQIKTQPTSRFVEDRNELTLGSINLSYDFFRHDFIKKIGLERLRFNFYMNDIVTWSSIRIERGTSYPFARSFSFSLSATF